MAVAAHPRLYPMDIISFRGYALVQIIYDSIDKGMLMQSLTNLSQAIENIRRHHAPQNLNAIIDVTENGIGFKLQVEQTIINFI